MFYLMVCPCLSCLCWLFYSPDLPPPVWDILSKFKSMVDTSESPWICPTIGRIGFIKSQNGNHSKKGFEQNWAILVKTIFWHFLLWMIFGFVTMKIHWEKIVLVWGGFGWFWVPKNQKTQKNPSQIGSTPLSHVESKKWILSVNHSHLEQNSGKNLGTTNAAPANVC